MAGMAWVGALFFSRMPLGSVDLPLVDRVDELKSSVDAYMSGSLSDAFGGKFGELSQILDEQFYYTWSIDPAKMNDNAFKGYIDALWDPFTTYFTSGENKSFNEDMQGAKNFEGIGAVIQKKEDAIMIEEVIKWWPAFKAWLQALDKIVEISGASTQSMTVDQAVNTIRGPKGTTIDLTVVRAASGNVERMTLTRDAISIPSVKGEAYTIDGKKIVYIELSIFGEDTKNAFEQALEDTQASKSVGIVLDLRWNGGGYLPKAVDIASYFLPKGTLVTTARYKSFPQEKFESAWYAMLQKKPVVVLVDGMTASASEILAAALREQGWAKLVWKKTFGKWSIQTIHEMQDGSSIKLTVGRRYPPSDKNVDKTWLEPDVDIAMDRDAFLSGVDTQLEQAKVTLGEMVSK